MDLQNIRKEFAIADKIVYLDSAALALKPRCVVDAINYYYSEIGISSRTSETPFANIIKKKYNQLKSQVAKLLDCNKEEIILVHNATDGLNYFALLIEPLISEDDEIIVAHMAHSSNILPLLFLARRKKAKLIISNDIISKISSKTKIIAMSQISNSIPDQNDFEKISNISRKKNIILINDAAQAIIHESVSLKKAEAICFSANKIFGPTAGGILAIQKSLLQKLEPKRYGGGSLAFLDNNLNVEFKDIPFAHEPGSLDCATIFGFVAALEFFDSLDKKAMHEHIYNLSCYAYQNLSKIKNLEIFSNQGDPIIIFRIKNISSQEIANSLGHKGVYVRSGYFCNPILDHSSNSDFVRISLNIYNNKNDIDQLVKLVLEGGDFLDFL